MNQTCKNVGRKVLMAFVLFLSTFLSVSAQTKVSGVVIDKNEDPVIGANVVVKGLPSVGASTDLNGTFTITLPKGHNELSVSCIGYKGKVVSVNGLANIKIMLENSATELDDVVVIGYGTTKKSDLTAAVSSIKGDAIRSSATTSLVDALQGKVPGMDVMSSREDGDNREIHIRGVRSLNAGNAPLVIVDGVPGSFDVVNTSDIASIEVLKDASSAAIYGSRGANGVIIITTHRGQSNGTTISYDAFFGVNKPHFMNMMKGEKFVQMRRDSYMIANNLWGQQVDDNKIFSDTEIEMIANGEYYDWQDLVFRDGSVQRHNISVSSGNERTRFAVSFAYEDVKGYNRNNEAKKYFLSAAIDHQIASWLDMSTTIRLRKRNHSGGAGYGQALFYGTPLCRPYDDEGKLIQYPNPQEAAVNILADYEPGQFANDTENTNADIVFSLNMHPFKWLRLVSNLGYQYSDIKKGYFYGSKSYQVNGGLNRSGKSGSNSYSLTWNNTLTFDKSWNRHNVTVDAISELQKYNTDWMSGDGRNLFVESLSYHNLGTNTENISIGSGYSDWSLLAFMGRVRYDYDRKYLANLSVRTDGSSRLAKGRKWATFVSGGVAWRISQEEFLRDVDWLSNLKIRYAYGTVGNQAIDPYSTLANLGSYAYKFGNDGTGGYGYRPDKLVNMDLGWEKTHTHNIGIDFGVFNNRLNGSVEYYNTKTDNLLMQRQIPTTTGFSRIWQNIGKTQNTGVELALNGLIINNRDLQWEVNLGLSVNNNKILELTNGKNDDITNRWFIGKPINVMYEYVKTGIWQTEEAEEASKYGRKPGDVKLKDSDNNGVITAEDKEILGSRDPKYITSFGSSLKWKNLDFSFNISGRWDYMIHHDGFGWNVILTGTRWVADVNYWTPDNHSKDYPRADATWADQRERCGDMKGDYLKMQDITLGYDFSPYVKKVLPISKLRLYVQARNAFYIYRAAKEDIIPESPSIESTVPKSFNVGINLTF